MIGTCTKCHKAYDFQSEEAAYEPDRLCPTCYKAKQAQEVKTYKCKGCPCKRVLTIERKPEHYALVMEAPDFTVWQAMTQGELEAEIAAAEDDENQFIVSEPYSQMSIILSDAQLADLRQWAGVAPPAAPPTPDKPLTKAQRAVMTTLVDVAENEGGHITLKNRYHSAAMALVRRGFVEKMDRDLYRPLYTITPAGLEYWRAITQPPDKPLTADQVRQMFAAMDKAAEERGSR